MKITTKLGEKLASGLIIVPVLASISAIKKLQLPSNHKRIRRPPIWQEPDLFDLKFCIRGGKWG